MRRAAGQQRCVICCYDLFLLSCDLACLRSSLLDPTACPEQHEQQPSEALQHSTDSPDYHAGYWLLMQQGGLLMTHDLQAV